MAATMMRPQRRPDSWWLPEHRMSTLCQECDLQAVPGYFLCYAHTRSLANVTLSEDYADHRTPTVTASRQLLSIESPVALVPFDVFLRHNGDVTAVPSTKCNAQLAETRSERVLTLPQSRVTIPAGQQWVALTRAPEHLMTEIVTCRVPPSTKEIELVVPEEFWPQRVHFGQLDPTPVAVRFWAEHRTDAPERVTLKLQYDNQATQEVTVTLSDRLPPTWLVSEYDRATRGSGGVEYRPPIEFLLTRTLVPLYLCRLSSPYDNRGVPVLEVPEKKDEPTIRAATSVTQYWFGRTPTRLVVEFTEGGRPFRKDFVPEPGRPGVLVYGLQLDDRKDDVVKFTSAEAYTADTDALEDWLDLDNRNLQAGWFGQPRFRDNVAQLIDERQRYPHGLTLGAVGVDKRDEQVWIIMGIHSNAKAGSNVATRLVTQLLKEADEAGVSFVTPQRPELNMVEILYRRLGGLQWHGGESIVVPTASWMHRLQERVGRRWRAFLGLDEKAQ